MAALDFPASPTLNQVYTANGQSWLWNGTSWVSQNNAVTIDTNNNASISGTLVMGSSFVRNRIINGGMAIDQRNAGAAQTFTAGAALAYSVDRWYGYCTGANVTGQRVTGAVSNTYRYQFTGAASVTAIGFGQRLEAINTADLNSQTVTLSAELANSLLTTVTWTAYYATSTDSFGTLASPTRTQIATGNFTVNSTVTRYTTTISVPAAAVTGIEVVFTVGAQTSGTWTIGNVQLEPGSIATPFERRQFGYELALAQRYFQKSFLQGTAPAQNVGRAGAIEGAAATASPNASGIVVYFPVMMRAVPSSVTTYNPSAANAQVRNQSRAQDCSSTTIDLANGISESHFYVFATPSAAQVVGDTLSVQYAAVAEL